MGVIVDSGLLFAEHCALQSIVDSAASAAAMDLLRGLPEEEVVATVSDLVTQRNGLETAAIEVHRPPQVGSYAGDTRYVEVRVTCNVETRFIQVLGGRSARTISAQAVAGVEPSTDGAAIVVLDPRPDRLQHPAGLDITASGFVRIEGAVLVNNGWGAVDENGDPAGSGADGSFGIRCSGSRIRAADIRVAGGVDDPRHYDRSELRANRFPVPDPLRNVPVPTLAVDWANVSGEEFGGIRVSGGNSELRPGVYEWIEISGGRATFLPGVYIVRGVDPQTGIALSLQGGTVNAQGVMFYITNSLDYSPLSGLPDEVDADDDAPPGASAVSVRSAMIDVGPQSRLSGLSDPQSPLNGILIFQRRQDTRSIDIRDWHWGGGNLIAGHVYARSGHVALRVRGTCQVSLVAGTAQLVVQGACRLAPPALLPPAEDVYVVQ
jgi:hypothetical protein